MPHDLLLALFDATREGIALLDDEERLIYVNDAMATAIGQPAAVLLGQTVRDVCPAFLYTIDARLEHRSGVRAPNGRVYDLTLVHVAGGTAIHARDVTTAQARFHLLTESVPVGVFLTDAQGHLVYVNPVLRDILGRSEDDMVGREWTHWVDAADASRVVSSWDAVRAGDGDHFDQSYRLSRSTGEARWVRTQVRQLRLATRSPGGFVGTVEDWTVHRAATERQRLLAATVDASPSFVGLADERMRIIHINPAGLEMVGLRDVGQVLRRPMADFVLGHDVAATLARTDRWMGELTLKHWARAQPILTDAHIFTVRESPTDPPTAFAMIARDIRERRRAEEAVRRQEERLAGILASAMDAIISVDWEGLIVLFNRAAEDMFRISAADATGQPLERFLSERPHGSMRLTGRRADDTAFVADVTVSSIDIAEERIETIIVRDMTEPLRLEEQLRQAAKMEALGQLAGGVAHDFNNLLTVITAYTGLLIERDSTDTLSELTEIANAARRAAALTRQLLVFSRKQLLQPRVVDVNGVILNLEPMLRALIDEDIEIVLSLQATLGPVYIDPAQIEQVIINLAVNARDAMPDGGLLHIETKTVQMRAGTFISLEVRDTGIGMDEGTRQRVFEPFFTTKEAGRGTGLGLAMVQGIVQQAMGHVWVESAPERGAVFHLLLPEASGARGAAEPLPVVTAPRGGTETILVAEDDPAVRELLHALLVSNGYTVLVAANGAEAFEIASRTTHAIDLLVTDVIMPSLGGRALVERLREARPDLRAIFSTGYAGDDVGRRGGLEPSAIIIDKPFTAAQLLAAVRRALDQSR